MFLQNIHLLNFKNYEEASLTFSRGINCLVGENGSGKTNLLDAIHYLCLSKSAFGTTETQHIRHGESFFMIQGRFELGGKVQEVDCNVQAGKGKMLRVNKKSYDKVSEHIGQFPCVLMAPYDVDLIREGSEFRRRFFDGVLSQVDALYLRNLMSYNNLLKQRNSLLKQFAERNYFDKDLIDTYDHQLIPLAVNLFEKRNAFLGRFIPLLEEYYRYLSNDREAVTLTYHSDAAHENFGAVFTSALQKDRMLQRTTRGIHKDDYVFGLGGYPISKFGSQGQQKSYLIALRLAQFEVIEQLKEVKPLLLLDDIFDKLDEMRISKLMQKIDRGELGQVFMTDARPERTAHLLENLDREVKVFRIAGGKPEPEK